MKINYYNQPKDLKIGEVLTEKILDRFDKAYIFSGFAKDSGINYLLPAIAESPIGEIVIGIGVDNKNTSKDMLLKIINMGAKLKILVNDEHEKVETRAYAFYREKGNSYVYLSGAKLSEGGLLDNESLVTEIIYSSDESKEFDELVQKLTLESCFKNTSQEDIANLAAKGEIVARITERKIPRISEMYSKEEVEIGTKEYDESTSNIKLEDYDDVDISVELPTGNVQVRNSLGSEVEQIIKKASRNLKGDLQEAEKNISSKILPKEKEVDYDHMSTFIFTIQGSDSTGIKIPNSMGRNIAKFIDYPDNFHVKEKGGKLSEYAQVVFEIFDNKTGNEAIDKEAAFSRKEKYISIESMLLKALNLEKDDIIRMMKKEKGKYRVEVIREGTDEHNIWSNYCHVILKGSTRKYGIV